MLLNMRTEMTEQRTDKMEEDTAEWLRSEVIEARRVADQSRTAITAHEQICAERYAIIHHRLDWLLYVLTALVLYMIGRNDLPELLRVLITR